MFSSAWKWLRWKWIKTTCSPPKQPIVFIIGTTGTGKSDLAVYIARKYDGEIINADAMQMYRGLPIVTNKMDSRERDGVPHHLFDHVDPLQLNYHVSEFRQDAGRIIDEIRSRNRLPIVAGGSLYYVESLIWELLISSSSETASSETYLSPSLLPLNPASANGAAIALSSEALRGIDSVELYKTLKLIDPVQATVIHPNDKRKIVRSLEVFIQHGRRHSQLINERQRDQPGGTSISGPLIRRDALILLLQCADDDELNSRLDQRVDKMIERGLVNELREFHQQYNKDRISSGEHHGNYQQGIFQSIGFKEFHDFLVLTQRHDDVNTTDADKTDAEKKQQKLWVAAVEQMKRRTRKYARSQTQWICNRMLRRPDRELPCTYGLDVSDNSRWHTDVLPRAEQIVAEFLAGGQSRHSPDRVVQARPALNAMDQQNYICDICERTLRGKQQYDEHLRSKSHRYFRKKTNKAKKRLLRANERAAEELVAQKVLRQSDSSLSYAETEADALHKFDAN